MKVLLIGKNGQLGWELGRSYPENITLVPCAFPGINLCSFTSVKTCIDKTMPDCIINAAAPDRKQLPYIKEEGIVKVSIMQPYFLPYIGYWQLMCNADIFVVYDDVNFIKQGWINRNRIVVNDKVSYITLPLYKASSFKKIKDVGANINRKKLLKTVYQAYKKAIMFEDAYSIFEKIINYKTDNLSDFVTNSLIVVKDYLDIDTKLIRSSTLDIPNELRSSERVKFVCKYLSKTPIYINAIGGTSLYDYEDFQKDGIDLRFLQSESKETMSILDLMFRYNRQELQQILMNYKELTNGIWAI